jgi:hypothetical protein
MLKLSAGVIAIAAVTVTAQQPPQAPITPHAYPLDDDHYVRFPLPAGEQAYGRIDGAHLKQYVVDITAVSRQSRDDGNAYWGRIAGTKYDDQIEGWAEQKFKAAGLEKVHRQYFDLPPQWFPTAWGITATGGGKRVTLTTAQPTYRTTPTRPGGLQVDAVWVGLGTAADFAGRDVRGKAVVIHTMLAPGQMGQSAISEAAFKRASEAGAAAILTIWGYYDNMAVWQGLGGGFSSPNSPPGFFLGFEDGKKLRDLIGAGPVKVKMSLKTEERENLKSVSIFGTLPGTTDETIIVMAHMDGWFDAALDNASGLSVMLTLAEHFAQVPKEKRRRNMIFIGTAGHHVGSPNAIYLRDKRPDLLAKTALMINCEHVSATQTLNWGTRLRRSTAVWPRRWNVNGSAKLTDTVLAAYKTFGVGVVGDMDPTATGEMGAIFRLAPSLQIIRSPENKHTDADIPELVPAVGLSAVGRAFAKIVDEANKLDRKALLPETPTTTASAGR